MMAFIKYATLRYALHVPQYQRLACQAQRYTGIHRTFVTFYTKSIIVSPFSII
jgi:hypothetical protein